MLEKIEILLLQTLFASFLVSRHRPIRLVLILLFCTSRCGRRWVGAVYSQIWTFFRYHLKSAFVDAWCNINTWSELGVWLSFCYWWWLHWVSRLWSTMWKIWSLSLKRNSRHQVPRHCISTGLTHCCWQLLVDNFEFFTVAGDRMGFRRQSRKGIWRFKEHWLNWYQRMLLLLIKLGVECFNSEFPFLKVFLSLSLIVTVMVDHA